VIFVLRRINKINIWSGEIMREILFKAKTIQSGKWVEGLLWKKKYKSEKVYISCFPDKDDHEEVYCVDTNTICQYIGWTDRNGNKLWENDIVEIVSSPKTSYKYLIWWNKEMSLMEAIPLDGIEFNGADYWNGKYHKFHYETFCTMMQDPWGDFSDIKVIGNIIDNPELIELK